MFGDRLINQALRHAPACWQAWCWDPMVFDPLLVPAHFVFRVAAWLGAKVLVVILCHALTGLGTVGTLVRREIGIMLRSAAEKCLAKTSEA